MKTETCKDISVMKEVTPGELPSIWLKYKKMNDKDLSTRATCLMLIGMHCKYCSASPICLHVINFFFSFIKIAPEVCFREINTHFFKSSIQLTLSKLTGGEICMADFIPREKRVVLNMQ